MWQLFRKYSCLILFLTTSLTALSNNKADLINPIFRDSVLKNNIDSARWNSMITYLDIYKKSNPQMLIQKQKNPLRSNAFLFISFTILLFLLVLRLIFEDLFYSILEGIYSIKKFFIFYKTKKYDSLFAILFIYSIKIIILSLILYIGVIDFRKDDFSDFSFARFLNITLMLGLFFTIKNMVEFIFNWIIDTQDTFKAFFLQNLFTELLLCVVVLILLMVYIYNSHISSDFMLFLMVACFGGYTVFNIVRSYQLMGNIRIPYKLHFFLYICAFKIIPVLLLARYVLNNIVQ